MNQHELNTNIENFIRNKDAKSESYSADEKAYINKYEGSGGQLKHGAAGKGHGAALYEFYTPQFIVKLMWELAEAHGYDGGNVLEPSCATGRLFEFAPDKSRCIGFEINPTSRRIAQINYPDATIHNGYFETAFLQPPRYFSRLPKGQTTWLPQVPFSLVLGNPPYGQYKNMYSSYFRSPKIPTLEMFFIYWALLLLKSGGLLIYLVSSNILRNGDKYAASKDLIGTLAELVDAYRLPSVFRFSEVPTDIIVLRKK